MEAGITATRYDADLADRVIEVLTERDRGALDVVAGIVAASLRAPIGLVTVVTEDRQEFIGRSGLRPELRSTPLSHSICQHIARSGQPLVLNDTRDHAFLADSLAVHELGVVAYCGVPFVDQEGRRLGAVCAIDVEGRSWDDEDVAALRQLSVVAAGVLASALGL